MFPSRSSIATVKATHYTQGGDDLSDEALNGIIKTVRALRTISEIQLIHTIHVYEMWVV